MSMTTAVERSAPRRNVTTQSSHAPVPSNRHSSQSIVTCSPMRRSCAGGVTGTTTSVEALDLGAVAAPAAGDRLEVLGEHLLVLDLQLAPDGEVPERGRAAREGHVEAREVAAGVAAEAHRATIRGPCASNVCSIPSRHAA